MLCCVAIPVLVAGPLEFFKGNISAVGQPTAKVVGTVTVSGAVKFCAIAGRDNGNLAYLRQVLGEVVQGCAQTLLRKCHALPQFQRGRAIVKAVCQYAHESLCDRKFRTRMITEVTETKQMNVSGKTCQGAT
jgi:hypothetical protein